MADPGFPRLGGANPEGGANLLLDIMLAKNCMKMKKIGAGVRIPRAPCLDPPMYFIQPK